MRPPVGDAAFDIPALAPGACAQISVELVLPGKSHEGSHDAHFEVVAFFSYFDRLAFSSSSFSLCIVIFNVSTWISIFSLSILF